MKLCKSCDTEKELTEFFSNGYTPNGVKKYKPTCKGCELKKDMARYYSIIEKFYGGMKCKVCGYNKCVAALDIHHRDPKEKEFEVSKMRNYSEQLIVAELAKCDLLCANCHREEHDRINRG